VDQLKNKLSLASPNTQRKVRYVLVGSTNTAIDFGLLFVLKAIGLPTVPSNVISTTCAFCFSFFANKKYIFKSTASNIKRELVLFVAVTLFGLWVLQSIIITGLTPLLAPLQLGEAQQLFVAKLLASVVTLVWNYVLYSRIVFAHHGDK
jgi:putative flippase GtrA